MMHLRVEQIGNGLHPSEVVVAVKTATGETERMVVSRQSVVNDQVEIGWPVRSKGDLFLIELPRETQSGAWRVWVDKSQVSEQIERKRA